MPETIINQFFVELDKKWASNTETKIPLMIIGSSALMMQTNYYRGTKDSDILETAEISPEIEQRLLKIGGKGSELQNRFGIYIDFVNSSLPFLPQNPFFHKIDSLSKLKHFEIHALDVVDIVVSKLKRFNANDVNDIQRIVDEGLIKHKQLLKRFNEAVDYYSMDARAEDLPRYVKNLNTVERDFLFMPESNIELPHWI